MIVINQESISSQALVSSPSSVSTVNMDCCSSMSPQQSQFINESYRVDSGIHIDNSCSESSCSTNGGAPTIGSGGESLCPGETRFYIGDEDIVYESPSALKTNYLKLGPCEFSDEMNQTTNSMALPPLNKLETYVMNIIDERSKIHHQDDQATLYRQMSKRYEQRYQTSESEARIVLNQDYDDQQTSPYNLKDLSDGDSEEKYFGNGSFGKVRIISVLLQVFLAIILSSAGNFGAGIILDLVQKWSVFHHVPELYYLIPTLLGLKGNLEMTMVARLSTQANMGRLNTFRRTMECMLVNISLVQCQAIVVSFLASTVTFLATYYETSSVEEGQQLFTTVMLSNDSHLLATNVTSILGESVGAIASSGSNSTFFYTKLLVIYSTSLFTANAACFGSSMFMIMMIVLLTNFKINPDNFATAIAASVGDIVTSFLLGLIGEYIFTNTVYLPGHPLPIDAGIRYNEDLRSPVLALSIIVIFMLLFPLLAWIACREKSTGKVLFGVSAWTPIIIAMVISFMSGAVLRIGAVMFRFMALFQPLINGVGGNLAAITTSRMSTELHMQSHSGVKTDREPLSKVISTSFNSFLQLFDHQNVLVIVFVIISIIVQLFYGYLLPLSQDDSHLITGLFYFLYVIASSFQVLLLLIFTRFLVQIIWWMGKDPDTCAIPILTAVGDLLGTIFLMTVFCTLRGLGNPTAAETLGGDESGSVESLMSVSIPTKTTMMVMSQLPFLNYTQTTALPF